MLVLISADMEGATGVTGGEDVQPGSARWLEARRLLTGDVNAAVEGFFDGGASGVIVNEAHADCRNLVLEELHPRAEVIRGRPKRFGMMEGIDLGAAFVAFVGYHGGAGLSGILSHTFIASGVVGIKLNGEPASEGRLNALLAGAFGVPVALVTGDQSACSDAQTYASDAATVAVKQDAGRTAARCLSPSASADAIRSAAADSVARPLTPTTINGRLQCEVEFATTSCAEAVTAIPSVAQSGTRTVSFAADDVVAAYRCLRAVLVIAVDAMDSIYG